MYKLKKIAQVLLRLICAAVAGWLVSLISANQQITVIVMTIIGAAAGYLAADIWIEHHSES